MDILTALLLVIIIVLVSLLLRKVESIAGKLDMLEKAVKPEDKSDSVTSTTDKPGQGSTRPPVD